MKYITLKRFKRDGISGRFNIPYGTIIEKLEDGVLYYNDQKICIARSAAAHEYFARDDDGKGLERGKLSHTIINRLSSKNFNSLQERNEFWQRIFNDSLAQKYRRAEHSDYWLWNDDFYNAPVEDLEYIAALVGVKKGL